MIIIMIITTSINIIWLFLAQGDYCRGCARCVRRLRRGVADNLDTNDNKIILLLLVYYYYHYYH